MSRRDKRSRVFVMDTSSFYGWDESLVADFVENYIRISHGLRDWKVNLGRASKSTPKGRKKVVCGVDQ